MQPAGNGQPLVATVIRDIDGFDALTAEWNALYAASPTATPFQGHAWLSAWAREYAPAKLRIAVVSDGAGLVAGAPLHAVRSGPWRVLTPLGRPLADHHDILLAPGPQMSEAVQALTSVLLGEPGWHVIDLPELRPTAAALEWARLWPGRLTRLVGTPSPELPGKPVPELLANIGGRTARKLRYHLRRADALGIETRLVEPADVPGGVNTLLRLHGEQWSGRGGNREHLTPRFAATLRAALPRMVADGTAQLIEYRLDGEVVAGEIDVVGHDLHGYWFVGIAPALKERMEVAPMLVARGIERTVAGGLPRYSMLRGLEDYKLRWHPDVVVNQRVLLSRTGGSGGAGFSLAVRGRAAVRRLARERAPWLREVRDRLRRRA